MGGEKTRQSGKAEKRKKCKAKMLHKQQHQQQQPTTTTTTLIQFDSIRFDFIHLKAASAEKDAVAAGEALRKAQDELGLVERELEFVKAERERIVSLGADADRRSREEREVSKGCWRSELQAQHDTTQRNNTNPTLRR